MISGEVIFPLQMTFKVIAVPPNIMSQKYYIRGDSKLLLRIYFTKWFELRYNHKNLASPDTVYVQIFEGRNFHCFCG